MSLTVRSGYLSAEGWAFYGEEMLMRNGLFERDPVMRPLAPGAFQ